MGLSGSYLGADLAVDAIDVDNRAYFGYCVQDDFRLQRCDACGTLRFPPSPLCRSCRGAAHTWVPVAGTGSVYTFTVVHQAVQAHMKALVPYAVIVAQLDTQPQRPLRVPAMLVDAMAMPLKVGGERHWGIGTRVRMRFAPAGDAIALPAWELVPATEG